MAGNRLWIVPDMRMIVGYVIFDGKPSLEPRVVSLGLTLL